METGTFVFSIDNRATPRRLAGIVLLALALPGVVQAARQHVAVPEVTWDAMLPYVRAKIVAELRGEEFHVFVCQDRTDRTVVEPFDDELSDLAKVLVTQAMRGDSMVFDGLDAATESFRQRVASLNVDERVRYQELFWQAVSEAPDLLPAIQTLFESSRRAGRLRCWLCERDPRFAPLARRVR